ncbi:hypothetical protein Q1695_007436 [Nippostrongylus brasiliensis]|nr:hypothetical protein Q1695_007436 [Nippostrongylus brasiliensis]
MERLLSRKQVSDDEANDVEVDNISFTSLKSYDDDDLRMSVQQSPIMSSFSDFKSASELSLHCQHRSDSECVSRTASPSCSKTDHTDLTPSSFSVDQEHDPKTLAASLEELEDEWIKHLYISSDLPPLPEIVSQEPYWKTVEQELIGLRQQNSGVSRDLEESNLYLYSLRLSLAAIEEARWLNDISKDPELSRLVREIDPQFPLAVNHIPPCLESCGSSTSGPINEGGDAPGPTCPPIEIDNDLDTRSTFFKSLRRPHRSHRQFNTVSSPSRKPQISWNDLVAINLESFTNVERIRDERVARWMNDMITNADKLLTLPSTSRGSSEENSHANCSQSSGDSEWAPPRESWIFSVSKSESVKVLLEAQKYRCFGCGIRVEKEYLKRVKFCDYYGKVFCQCCHQGLRSIIPARILHTWNFNEFPVCDIAFHFLLEVRDVPAIHVNSVAPQMVEKIRVLKHVISLREKLSYMWDFVRECPEAENTETKNGHLRTLFTSIEQHLLTSHDLFSLSDLVRVHNKDMSSLLEPIAHFARAHIEACEHCRQYAATCVYCGDEKELLFSFQLEKVHKCASCASLSHIKCQAKFRRKVACQSGCKRCLRLDKDK